MEEPGGRPAGISLRVAAELETAVGQIYAAYRNQGEYPSSSLCLKHGMKRSLVHLDYSLEDMRESLNSKPDNINQRDFLRQNFPSPFPQGPGGRPYLVEGPTMIVDSAEKLAMCFLPGVFTDRRRVSTSFNAGTDGHGTRVGHYMGNFP